MTDVHRSGTNRSIEWKRTQLKSLKRMLFENKGQFLEAVAKDLGKHPIEAEVGEISRTLSEIDELLRQLPSYAKPQQVPSPGVLLPAFSEIRYEALRSPGVLIIAPFNYPINLSLVPAAGSLAAGNPTVLKPSELTPTVSSLFAKLIPQYFDASAFSIIEGGIAETTSLLKHPWGLVFFTGSTRVGKIVSARAAETLTPVILELGGKSPTYIAKDCPNIKVVADRIIWGKTTNAGQTCVAPDYVLCHVDVLDQFIKQAIESLQRMFGEHVQNADLSRIVNENTAQRLIAGIEEVEKSGGEKGKVVHGGLEVCDAKGRFVSPTLILEPSLDTKLMREEIFGPIMPIIPVSSDEEAIKYIAKQQGDMTPLAFYVFTRSSKVFDKMAASCPSAAVVRNDVIVQFSSSYLPIGGLGTSGSGHYHGKYSIESFSHKRATVYKPATTMFEYGGVRYPPYSGIKGRALLFLSGMPKVPVIYSPILGSIVVLLAGMMYGGKYVPAIQGLKECLMNLIADALMELSLMLRYE